MNKLLAVGKFLDQPRLVHNLSRAVPAVLIAGGAGYTYVHVKNTPRQNKQQELIKSICVWGVTIPCALISPKVALKMTEAVMKKTSKQAHSKITEVVVKKTSKNAHSNILTHTTNVHHHDIHCDCHEHSHGEQFDAEKAKKLIEKFVSKNKVSPDTLKILNKAKSKVLSPSEIKTVYEELGSDKKHEKFLREFIPDPENIDSNHIFGEIGRISIMGALTVAGGMSGGIIGDMLTEKNWQKGIPNKIKEGAYQFLANIFLCNVGAGVALCLMERGAKIVDKYKQEGIPEKGFNKIAFNVLNKLNLQSKPARAIGMTTGIVLAGIVFGSAIANVISKKIIDPLMGKRHQKETLYSERTPELLDVGLHADDMTTVAVLSGLKWIEPALPILYSISGYRAGIGYRNGEH